MGKGQKGNSGSADGASGDNIRLAEVGQSFVRQSWGGGRRALAISAFLGAGENDGWTRFSHSYLVAFVWVMTIGAGALWWLTLQNIVNSHWSMVIRRVAELIAANAPVTRALGAARRAAADPGQAHHVQVGRQLADDGRSRAQSRLPQHEVLLDPLRLLLRILDLAQLLLPQ